MSARNRSAGSSSRSSPSVIRTPSTTAAGGLVAPPHADSNVARMATAASARKREVTGNTPTILDSLPQCAFHPSGETDTPHGLVDRDVQGLRGPVVRRFGDADLQVGLSRVVERNGAHSHL